jgi:hypothetical protein
MFASLSVGAALVSDAINGQMLAVLFDPEYSLIGLAYARRAQCLTDAKRTLSATGVSL